MTANRFQLCAGPSGNRAHIRDTQGRSLLVLCERTAPAHDLKGAVAAEVLCPLCMKVMVKLIAEENIAQLKPAAQATINAELLGCQEII